MSYGLKAGSVETVVVTDPYIPLNIRFGEEDLDVDRLGLYGPRGELLEIAVSMASAEVCELTFVHCEEYRKIDGFLTVPAAQSGVVSLELPDRTDVPLFDVLVYSDGLQLVFSDAEVETYLRHGNAVFGIAAGSIAEVLLCDVDPGVIAAMVETIDSTASQKDVVLFYDGDDDE